MTKSEAFLRQAQSDFQVFELLLGCDREKIPECHPLHYLQMCTEKLAKAAIVLHDPTFSERQTHEPAQRFFQVLNRREVAAALGWDWPGYQRYLRQISQAYVLVGGLCPAGHVVNSEYPWQDGQTWVAPAKHPFGVLADLAVSEVSLVHFVRVTIEQFEALPLSGADPDTEAPSD